MRVALRSNAYDLAFNWLPRGARISTSRNLVGFNVAVVMAHPLQCLGIDLRQST